MKITKKYVRIKFDTIRAELDAIEQFLIDDRNDTVVEYLDDQIRTLEAIRQAICLAPGRIPRE